MNQDNARLGSVIRKLRQERGVSQEIFADMAGVHRTYVSQLERGIKSPTIAILSKIADALEIKASDLLRLVEAS